MFGVVEDYIKSRVHHSGDILVEMPVICHTQWNPEVEYSSIFIFVSVTWGHTDT